MATNDDAVEFYTALLAAQKEMDSASKDAKNPAFKSSYASLASVIEAIRPALNKHGIVILQPTYAARDGEFAVLRSSITLIHAETGFSDSFSCDMLISGTAKPQDQGSAITYNRRYSLMSLFCIPTEDDDGNKANAAEEDSLVSRFTAAVTTADAAKLRDLSARLPTLSVSKANKDRLQVLIIERSKEVK